MKCVPIAALCLFVIMHGLNLKFECSYSRRIFVGLLFSMIGDACLVYKEQYFVPGLISFAVAHVIYFTAFGIKPFNIRLALALMALCVPISAIYIPFITSYVLKVLVPAYILLILSMLWRAISRLCIFNKEVEWTWTKLCCTLGNNLTLDHSYQPVTKQLLVSLLFLKVLSASSSPIRFSHSTCSFTKYHTAIR